MNNDYFNKWTSDMAYYLGWIWADGCLTRNQYTLSLSSIRENEYLLKDFKRAIDSHHKISQYQDKRWGKPESRFSVCGKEFIKPLVEKHGLVPGKSFLDCSFPYIPKSFLPHFVRGHFDGDGSLVETSQGYAKISIVGTKKFMTGLRDAISDNTGLPKQKIKKHKPSKFAYYLEYCRKEQILAFLNYIYPKGEYPFMKSKRQKAESLIPSLESFWANFGIDMNKGKWRLRLNGGKHFGYFETKAEAIKIRTEILGTVDFRYNK